MNKLFHTQRQIRGLYGFKILKYRYWAKQINEIHLINKNLSQLIVFLKNLHK